MQTPKAIHQLVAGYSNGDAISNETRVMRSIFKDWGFASEIFCEHHRTLPELRKDALDLPRAAEVIQPDDLVLLHLSIGSEANRIFKSLPGRKIILYHNVTPASYFRAVNEGIANALEEGRQEAAQLHDAAEINLADSLYNAQELLQWGYQNPQVLPLILDLNGFQAPPHRGILSGYQDGLTNILFVGRCVPNKRLEDLLHAFYYYQHYVNPNSRFIHAGSFAGTEPYLAMLETIKKNLGLENVDFLGSIPDDQLRACYQAADLFLCMSEHEGFCIPLLEAMINKVPVLAFAGAAVPETMDGAGVTFSEKNFDEIGEMMGQLTTPGPLRKAIIAGQETRIQRYRQRDLASELRAVFMPLLG